MVTQLARNQHILGEMLPAKPRDAHPQLTPSCLPDAIPLDSSKWKGKVLLSIFARQMRIPASASLESLAAGSLGCLCYPTAKAPLSPLGITKCYCLTPMCTSLLTVMLAFFLASLHQQ